MNKNPQPNTSHTLKVPLAMPETPKKERKSPTFNTNYVIKNVKLGSFFHVTMAALATDLQAASRFPYSDTAISVSKRLGTDYRVIKVRVDKQSGLVSLWD